MAEQLQIPEEKKKGGFFSSKPKLPVVSAVSQQVSDEMTEQGRRLRIMEERFSNLRTKLQMLEHNMLSHHKQISTEIKTSNADVHELKKELHEMKERLLMLIKELQAFAQKEDVKVLEKYINLWQPLNFVTRNEVKDIINDILTEQKSDKS